MNKITVVGLDLAKNVFQVHGADARGQAVVRKPLKRKDVLAFFAKLPPCLIGMEACGGAHHWARRFQAQGHTVKLMAPQYVKPFVQRHKTDARDAQAICEAANRASIPTVAVKTTEQQAVLALHRVRQSLMKARVAQIDQRLTHWHRSNDASRRLEALPGVGMLTATALVAEVGDAKHFARGRQFAAWVGLTPREHSSGGQSIRLGISKRGNRYLRTLLIHGARAVLKARMNKPEHVQDWAVRVSDRRGHNVAAVAQANKTARRAWALLTKGEEFNPEYVRERAAA